MLNEFEEFRAYTEEPVYINEGKSDLSFLGRFTLEMLLDFKGFHRILTIIARGYLFKSGGDPYDNINYARRALCTWCSVPENEDKESDDWKFTSDFRQYHDEFPELVDTKGRGWLIRHVHGIIAYAKAKPDKISITAKRSIDRLKGFDEEWRNKVIQMQVPLFSPETYGTWLLLFDSILADALEEGELKNKSFSFSADQQERIRSELPKGVPYNVAETVLAYAIANKPEDSDWTVLPVMNMSAYFGSSTFRKKWLAMMPPSLLVKDEDQCSVCRVRAMI